MLLILLDWLFGLVEVALGEKSSLVSMAVPGKDAVRFLDSALGRLRDLSCWRGFTMESYQMSQK